MFVCMCIWPLTRFMFISLYICEYPLDKKINELSETSRFMEVNFMHFPKLSKKLDESGVEPKTSPMLRAVSYTHLDVYKRQVLQR